MGSTITAYLIDIVGISILAWTGTTICCGRCLHGGGDCPVPDYPARVYPNGASVANATVVRVADIERYRGQGLSCWPVGLMQASRTGRGQLPPLEAYTAACLIGQIP
jgi:hypothetical protein